MRSCRRARLPGDACLLSSLSSRRLGAIWQVILPGRGQADARQSLCVNDKPTILVAKRGHGQREGEHAGNEEHGGPQVPPPLLSAACAATQKVPAHAAMIVPATYVHK